MTEQESYPGPKALLKALEELDTAAGSNEDFVRHTCHYPEGECSCCTAWYRRSDLALVLLGLAEVVVELMRRWPRTATAHEDAERKLREVWEVMHANTSG